IDHNIAPRIVFWESNKIADGFLSAQNGNKSIQSKSDSAVRWRAVLERIHQKPELCFCLFGRKAQIIEHQCLCFFIVDSYRTSADFISIQNQIVRICFYFAWIGGQKFQLSRFWGSERVVHRVETVCFLVPFQKREIHNPQWSEFSILS